jgi:hypothetical protein
MSGQMAGNGAVIDKRVQSMLPAKRTALVPDAVLESRHHRTSFAPEIPVNDEKRWV